MGLRMCWLFFNVVFSYEHNGIHVFSVISVIILSLALLLLYSCHLVFYSAYFHRLYGLDMFLRVIGAHTDISMKCNYRGQNKRLIHG